MPFTPPRYLPWISRVIGSATIAGSLILLVIGQGSNAPAYMMGIVLGAVTFYLGETHRGVWIV